MGWLFYSTPACIRDEIARICTWENDDGRGYPVLISKQGSTWCAAVRSEPAGGRREDGLDGTGSFETDATGGYTFGAVFLTRRSGSEWGYKDMDETMGPNESGAPVKLLDLLSPTTSEYALDWRERCRRNAAREARPLKEGDVIRFEEPLRFTDGTEHQTFRVTLELLPGAKRRRMAFISTETGGRYCISAIKSRNWTRI